MCLGPCRAAASCHIRSIPPLSSRCQPPRPSQSTNVEPLNSVHFQAAVLPRHHSNIMPSSVNAFHYATSVQRHSITATPSPIKQVEQAPFILPPTIARPSFILI
ncbi:hypothetical protein Aduo_008993 [Ancylostoma duodenale]